MEEILTAASAAGFTTWGFTPHGPLIIPSPCNMKAEDVPKYLEEVERLKPMFPEMKILAGMEIDFLEEEQGPASPYVKEYGLDYVIGSVHFIPNQKGDFYDIDGSPERFRNTLKEHFDDDLMYVVRTFWTQTQRMIKAVGFDIIGHIDKIALNASSVLPEIEDDPEYSRLSQETIEMAISSGKSIEINTKHWEKYGRFFPHPRYWARIRQAGIQMPVNTDTHYAAMVESGREAALELIKKIGA